MKGRVIALGILSFILMCFLIFIIIYLATDGIYRNQTVYIPSERMSISLDGPYHVALRAFAYITWFSFAVWVASAILGVIHIQQKDEVAREINTTIGWLAIFLSPFNWIACICALVKFRRIERDKDSPENIEIIETKRKNAINKLEIRNILMGAMSIIAMICLILYIAWLADVEGRRFIYSFPGDRQSWIENDRRGTNEEAAIAELCVGLGAWLISIIIGIVHLAKEMKAEKSLNKTTGILAIVFAPVNWIFCIIAIIKMKKQKVNI